LPSFGGCLREAGGGRSLAGFGGGGYSGEWVEGQKGQTPRTDPGITIGFATGGGSVSDEIRKVPPPVDLKLSKTISSKSVPFFMHILNILNFLGFYRSYVVSHTFQFYVYLRHFFLDLYRSYVVSHTFQLLFNYIHFILEIFS
jgi:hypothetical protein